MLALFETIQAGNRHAFLQPTSSISNASLQLAKATLDSYASQVSDEQQQRQKEANKKRKRAENATSKIEVLKIRRLHVDGFESGQVWQQARRIITSTLQDSKEALRELEDRNEVRTNGVNGDAESLRSPDANSETGSDGSEEDSGEEDLLDSEEDLDEADEDVSIEDLGELVEDDIEEVVEAEEDDEGIEEDEDEDENLDEDEESGTLVEDPNGLNDGFFSIDDFNKQTQWFEEQDAKANPDADQESDDEEIDWHTDPMSTNPLAGDKPSKKTVDEDRDELPSVLEDDEDEDGGPTFGNIDLDAPEGESDLDEVEDSADGENGFNANDIFYENFFAPPKRKGSKRSRPQKLVKPRPTAPADQDIDRAMADVHRDLFEDESEREDSDDALSDVSAGDLKSRKSAHERRQAKLAEEIRKLESANVTKREWAMAGEAKAADRPMNSLLEEVLDFEHVGKPIPVITTTVSESIEDMIKQRILAQEFDEVIRRRPDSAERSSSAANTRRGLVELDDSKAKQSLAEIYEEEHTKSANPDTYVGKSDEKLRREEREVEQMWRDAAAKLDALSSWHYRPKPAAPALTVVADVATVSMEDAQPATAQGVTGGDTALAPQEIYAPGRDAVAEKGEVVPAKSGLPVARQEMSREDRTRRRRRQKERIRKAGGGGPGDGTNGNNKVAAAAAPGKEKKSRAQARQDTLGDLRKGGVKVINKKGEILDMEGNKARAAKAASSGSFKL